MTSDRSANPAQLASPWLVVVILLIFYVFSFLDRVVVNMMVGPLQADLGISDFQMSLLQGPLFGAFYVVAGLGMGYLIDRFSKRRLVALGVAIWGGATFLSGLARSFGQLAIGRMGVGVGESVLTPAAHSIISENFRSDRLATAMSVYTSGAIVGGAIALVLGGEIVHFATAQDLPAVPLIGIVRGWQAVFLIIGGATLLLLPLTMFVPGLVKGPKAGAVEGIGIWPHIANHWKLYILLPVGFGCTNILVNSYTAWHPTFMARTYGLDIKTVGWMLGVQHLVTGLVGQIGGAMVVDALYRRGVLDAHVKYQMVGIVVSVPMMILALKADSALGFILLSAFFYCLCYPFVAYAAAAMQLFTPSHLRARVSAIFLALVTIVGSVIGAPATGWLTDKVFADKSRVGDSMIIVTVVVTPVILAILWAVAREMRRMHEGRGPRTGIGFH